MRIFRCAQNVSFSHVWIMSCSEHVDYVLEHELKEAGVHIMICTASYLEASGDDCLCFLCAYGDGC